MSIDWGFSVAVVITGLVVVFVLLFLLVAICTLMGKIFTAKANKAKAAAAAATKAAAPAPTPAPTAAPAPVVEMVYDGVGDDEVAAISAAIAVIMSDSGNQPFVIKSIKKAKEARPAWRTAGIANNTQPF